jgi:hypothetical protein
LLFIVVIAVVIVRTSLELILCSDLEDEKWAAQTVTHLAQTVSSSPKRTTVQKVQSCSIPEGLKGRQNTVAKHAKHRNTQKNKISNQSV